ncbi:LppX_LprAFG lipoprotein [Aeromicrobium marinum]|uniref:LppX_LprAFG lipoprotein n=1 Tax=Aeromicrobium marinum TaxID=219314 RepID=UPI00058DD9F5|nr:LppX_LprAFG lipoprotein [Aeromicrobium marinum]
MRIRLIIAVLAALVVTACSGGGDTEESGVDTSGLAERLAAAQQVLDDAERLDVSISTDALPTGVTGLKSAKGFGNHSPAFEGDVTVVTGGASLDAEVVATGGEVFAKTGFSPVFLSIDPETLGAPDPANLVGTAGGGLASVLTEVTITGTDRSRDGEDVLTSISGTLSGEVIARFLPSADPDGTFDVTFRLSDDDELRDATISGPFYPGAGDVTYTITLQASDEPADITAPGRPGGS